MTENIKTHRGNIVENTQNNFFELRSLDNNPRAPGILCLKPIIMVGRSINCDLVVNDPEVSSVHAVIEIQGDKGVVHDMQSRSGVFINDRRIEMQSVFSLNDVFRFGSYRFEFCQYQGGNDPAKWGRPKDVVEAAENIELPPAPPLPPVEPKIPFSNQEARDNSEYIFEDLDQVYPIFDYSSKEPCVEILTIFKEDLLGADYVPKRPGIVKIDQLPVLEITQDQIQIYHREGFETYVFSGNFHKVAPDAKVYLESDQVVSLVSRDLQLYFKRVTRPPMVTPAPFLPKDPNLWKKYLIPFVAVTITLFVLFLLVEVSQEDIEKRNEVALDKTLKEKINRPIIAKVAVSEENQTSLKGEIKDTQTEKNSVDTKQRQENLASNSQKSSPKSNQKPSVAEAEPVYKGIDVKSTLKNVLNNTKINAINAKNDNNKRGASSPTSSAGDALGIENNKTDLNSLQGLSQGLTSGSENSIAKGAQGLSDKKGILTAEIPTKTVVRGSMDPELILALLRQHLPQFRHCYQSYLDKAPRDARFEGAIKLNFRITPSGEVGKSQTTAQGQLPFLNCIDQVVMGIIFPAPKGGGVVDVTQSLNFNLSNN